MLRGLLVPLERADLPFLFPLLLGLQRTPYLQATRALVPPPGEACDEASIYLALCRAAGAPLFGSKIAQAALEDVVADVGGGVAQVGRVVGRDAARVHGDDTVDRLEGDDRLSGGVVQAHGGAG